MGDKFKKIPRIILATFIFLIVFTNSAFASDTTGPYNLIAAPFSTEEGTVTTDWGIELIWDSGSETVNEYDIWMSKNGYEWGEPLATVSGTTYVINDKEVIKPNTNYYFIVSIAGIDNPYNHVDASDIAIAFPTRESVHGNYKKNTNACAKCHRTHADADPEDPNDIIPIGQKLLIFGTVDDTCKTCHDGTQSKYDVFRGQIETPAPSFLKSSSGAFGDVFDQGIGSTTMSMHSVGDSTYTLRSALRNPSNTDFPDGPEWQKPFGCGSCHVVHAQEYNESEDSYKYLGTNYRMLAKKLPAYKDIADFKVNVLAFAETSTVSDASYGENIYYRSGMTEFCVGCHADYYEKTTVDSQVYEKVIHNELQLQPHSINVAPSDYKDKFEVPAPISTTLPLEGNNNGADYNKNKIMCLTCHSAHGSDTYRDTDKPNFLLRENESGGICDRCHTGIGQN